MFRIICILFFWIALSVLVHGKDFLFMLDGHVPVSFKQNVYTPKWIKVLPKIQSFCKEGSCPVDFIDELKNLSHPKEVELFRKVHWYVNVSIKYVNESEGRDDWLAPTKTLDQGFGDCEDIAILKMAILHYLGVPLDRMFLVILKAKTADTGKRVDDHAILVIRLSHDQVMVYDIVRRTQFSRYTPYFAYSDDNSWVFGKVVSSLEKND